ncbi:hypothetical protein A5721_23915 [Mycobacterium vulneris]|nr:hypothetical protein A5721_23915 [Mycolicibacterium vulneris]
MSNSNAALIDALAPALPEAFTVTATPYAGVDVHVKPEFALNDRCDIVGVMRDDDTIRVVHMTHNRVIRGEVKLSGTMTGLLTTVVLNIIETF